MAEVIWTVPAFNDLDEITDYIALDKVSAAIKLADKILEKVKRLADFPESGRLLPEFDNDKYREVIVQPCRILYYIEQDKVYITHVMRSERQLRRYMIHECNPKYETNDENKPSP